MSAKAPIDNVSCCDILILSDILFWNSQFAFNKLCVMFPKILNKHLVQSSKETYKTTINREKKNIHYQQYSGWMVSTIWKSIDFGLFTKFYDSQSVHSTCQIDSSFELWSFKAYISQLCEIVVSCHKNSPAFKLIVFRTPQDY